jgi:hypothetical protein
MGNLCSFNKTAVFTNTSAGFVIYSFKINIMRFGFFRQAANITFELMSFCGLNIFCRFVLTDKIAEIAYMLAEKEKTETMQLNVWVLNGPNLNFLGIREPAIYGTQNYPALVNYVQEEGAKLNMKVRCLQSNYEGELIDWLQDAYDEGLIIN